MTDGENETNWFWRIPPIPREAALAVGAVLLVAAPFFLLDLITPSCSPIIWLFPAGQLFGGAAIFGLSQFLPVRALGCLTILACLPTAFLNMLCGL
jgi:hypothetical protein